MAEAAAPDVSLADHGFEPVEARGLTYPLGGFVPTYGDVHRLAPGIGWTRMPVPGPLDHINVWLLEDGDAPTIVDTGLHMSASKEAWAKALAGRRAGRVVVTHFHPDHLGCAGWLCREHGARLWMSRGEWLTAKMILSDLRDAPPEEEIARLVAAGWDEAQVARVRKGGWGRFARAVSPVPISYVRIRDGDVVRIGDRDWTVVVGSGHSPEHACLIDFDGKVMIAGDQVLPRITSNVSMALSEPEADPLGEWLASIARFRELPADLLVLPAHGEPFTGLHARLDRLEKGHRDSLDRLHAHLAEAPRRGVDCFGLLFKRTIDDSIRGLATGEAMAHLRRLEVEGRAVRDDRDGVAWFRAA